MSCKSDPNACSPSRVSTHHFSERVHKHFERGIPTGTQAPIPPIPALRDIGAEMRVQ